MSFKSDTCFSQRDGTALTTYEYEEEAKSGAEYANIKYDRNLVPYQCDRCSLWHLTPKDRHTRSRECSYCTDSNGSYKQLYFSHDEAKKRANILFQEHGVLLNIYECPHENGFHLTKK